MSLSSQALQVLGTVRDNENKQALVNYNDALRVWNTVTVPNWVATNIQSRNLANNIGFVATPPPTPPALVVYTLNNDTGEITTSNQVDSNIPVPTLPPYVSASGNAFATLQSTLTANEEDLNTVTLQSISNKLDKVLSALGIS